MNKKTTFIIIILIIILLIFDLFLIRLISPQEIPCQKEYVEKSGILWIIPKFNNKSISENKTWCNYILSLNKTLGLHGVTHEFKEFNTNKNSEYLQEGINIFEECFGFKPEIFKPPQLKISKENKKLIEDNNIKLKGRFNQIIHKVYHCNDTGRLPNWVVDLF